MTRSLEGKRIVITGALGGIGSTASVELRAAGAVVGGIDLRAAPEVEAADVTDRAALTAAVERIAERMGGIDILINNAGIAYAQDSGEFPDDAAREVMNVNFFGAWNTTAAAMPYLLASRGHIVNVSSGLSVVDVPYAVAYSASKRALDAYSNALRIEYSNRVSVTSVHPGYIRTAIHEAPAANGASLEGLVHADTVEQAGRAIVRACMERPRAMTTSRRSALELWAARRLSRSVERELARRFRRRHAIRSPTFLRFPI